MRPYQSRWSKELDLEQGELVHILYKEDQSWWFGRLTNGHEGFFPAACVQPMAYTASSASTTSTALPEVHIFLIPRSETHIYHVTFIQFLLLLFDQ